MTSRLVRVARAWLVIGNTAALTFTTCIALLYLYCRTDTNIQIGVNQLGANAHEFFMPVIVSSIATLVTHMLVLVYSFSSARQHVDRVTARIGRPRTTQIYPTLSPVFPGYLRVVGDKLTVTKAQTINAWSRYSAEITRIFMLWEISLQIFQAYKMSYLVASVSINRLIALVIVTNCWFSPVLHYVMGNRPVARIRLGRLLLDSSLDIVYSIIIPLCIVYPYYRDFNSSVTLYPVVFYYNDIWYVNAISELRQIFVVSWPDFISKSSGCLSLIYRLWRLKIAVDIACEKATLSASGGPTQANAERFSSFIHSTRSRLSRVLDLVLLLCGATVLSLHLASSITSLRYHDPDCLLEMRPWGSLAYSCASLEISCSKRHTAGDRNTMEAILSTVDPLSVQNLILSNCPLLHVPSAIQKLQSLTMIKVYNSTIVSWDTQAALRQVYHPQLQALYFTRMNVTNFPEGLVADDFPSSVWDIEFCITNITTFPPAITTAWANVGMFAHEGNRELAEYPEVLTTLPSVFIMVLGMNNIASMKDGALATRSLLNLDMNGNPIDRLPDDIGNLDQLQLLQFVGTKIAEIPSAWMDIPMPASKPSGYTVLYAAGSPLCESTEAQTVVKPTWLSINCEIPPDGLYSYPIHEEDAWRRANQ